MSHGHELGSLSTTAEEYRRLNGLDEEPVHIDQEDPKLTPQAFEPENGYGGEDGDPDTSSDAQGALPFAVQRAQGDAVEGDLDESPKHMAENGEPSDEELERLTAPDDLDVEGDPVDDDGQKDDEE